LTVPKTFKVNIVMNYSAHYQKLILRAIERERDPTQYFERHHIVPRSQGGLDDPLNIVLLTVREHYVAHLLLWRMDNPNQIFSVQCFLDDAINIHRPYRFGQFRYKRFIRKAIAYQRAENTRFSNQLKVLKSINSQLARYNNQLKQIDRDYAHAIFDVAGMEQEG
jgi:hypothetical protein